MFSNLQAFAPAFFWLRVSLTSASILTRVQGSFHIFFSPIKGKEVAKHSFLCSPKARCIVSVQHCLVVTSLHSCLPANLCFCEAQACATFSLLRCPVAVGGWCEIPSVWSLLISLQVQSISPSSVVPYPLVTDNMALALIASMSPESSLEMHTLCPHLRPAEPESGGSYILCT